CQVVGAKPIRVAGWRALIDASRQRTHLSHLICDLQTHQMSTQADLAALPDEDFAGIGDPQVVRIEAVARLDALVEPLRRVTTLVRNHPALPRARRRPGQGRAARERDLRLVRERAEAHARDVDWDVEHDWSLCTRTENGLGLALFSVTFDHKAGQR